MPYNLGSFPASRMRRNRLNQGVRDMVAEHNITIQDLIWPIFVREDDDDATIELMPNVTRYAIGELGYVRDIILQYNIPAIAIFPKTPNHLKDAQGSESLNENNLVCRALQKMHQLLGDARHSCNIIVDIALDPYTSHGHDGVMVNHKIANDETVEKLTQQALLLSAMGADILAPSDMMDGRIATIRQALEQHHYDDMIILSYAAKYASHFYGPFRQAVGSGQLLQGDKKTYQMDYRNHHEALREIAKDLDEGADMVMVKPAMSYMDIIYHAKQEFQAPLIAYQVSGEYSMLSLTANVGAFDHDAIMMESLTSLKRAGADAIISYFAPRVCALLHTS